MKRPRCRCGGKSIGWGSYKRRIRLGEFIEAVASFPVKRWRCKSCRRTFSHLPPFVLVLKRYAAALVQGVWEERVNGVPTDEAATSSAGAEWRLSLERLAERWGLPCVVTVRRWLLPLEIHAEGIEAEFRRVLRQDVKEHVKEQCPVGERLLSLAQRVTSHVPHHPVDRDRVPYHHVLHIVGRLQACNG